MTTGSIGIGYNQPSIGIGYNQPSMGIGYNQPGYIPVHRSTCCNLL